jgi:hypothetical protein
VRKLADSLLLALSNLGVIGLVYLCSVLHIGSTKLGTAVIYLLALASPVLLLATAIYLPRDLIRRVSRTQTIIALVLSIPAVKFLTLLRPP